MLLQPFLGALLALGEANWTVVPALAAVLAVFVAREPLIVLARQRWIWRDPHPETPRARRELLWLMLVLACSGAWLVTVWPVWLIALMGGAAAILTGLAVYMTARNRQREVWFQILSATGLSSSCVAACLAIRLEIPGWCWWWWGLHAVHFLTGILVVHVRLEARIQARMQQKKPGGEATFDHAFGGDAFGRMRKQAVRIQTAAAAATIVPILLGHLYYAAAMAVSAVVHFLDLRGAHTPGAIAMPMSTVGKRALALSIAFTVLLVAGAWLG